ncbi:conserved hypothetical protein [Synechococcus sp. PCC 7335]|uniref:DUF1499 domain-containing protein n=1 Tax=Synechococcus sp. (strain ATCC 29403 / PCC 7335) TaxID=91464 RepID=UPI00017EB8C8|nr:DUF1499 domain-containing protein [Synechococcus sp. PCC 7335]EDX87694.1 conserved hypothetical protein [Synechococcus sp. PCC 7335]
MGLFSFSGTPPTDLGVKDGRLKACPGTPNCVCSHTPTDDTEHAISPLTFTGSAKDAIARLKTIIEGMERSKINTVSDDYLYAEFSSKLMGFVDDVEFYVPAGESVIHTRSAARLGKSDLGANRKRTEEIRKKFTAS